MSPGKADRLEEKEGPRSLELKTVYWEEVKSKGGCGWKEKQYQIRVKISRF